MKHQVVITIILVLAVFVLLLLFLKPEWIQSAWLWAIGLMGSAAAFFKRGFQKFAGGDKINDIEDSNNAVKIQIKQLEERIQKTNERYELEKQLYQKDIELLNQRILLKEKEIDLERQKRQTIEQMSWQEYYKSLTPEQKNKIQEDQDLHTIDIN